MAETFEGHEGEEKLQKVIEQLRRIEFFKTEKLSVYRYDNNEHSERKRYSGEEYSLQDITSFINLNSEEGEDISESLADKSKNVCIVEEQLDGSPKVINNINEVSDPDKLYLVIITDNKIIKSKKAILMPTEGYSVYDYKISKKNGKDFIQGHLGHKVTEIISKQ